MSLLAVTYRTWPAAADDNQSHVETVFAELAELAPDGFGDACLRLADHRFIHLADLASDRNPLLTLAAFPASARRWPVAANPARSRTRRQRD